MAGVLSVGPNAYVYGASVLALLNLVPTDPTRLFIATRRRSRRTLRFPNSTKSWTKAALSSLGLNERQIAAVKYVKNAGAITLRAYLALTSAPHRTAVRELQGLVSAGVFLSQGAGRNVEYVLNINRATFVPIVPPPKVVHRKKSASANKIKGQTTRKGKSTPQDTSCSGEHVREHVCEQVERLVLACKCAMPEKDLREAVGVKNRPNFTVRHLTRALEGGYIERTASGTRSPTQKYRLTDKGRSLAGQLSKKKSAAK